MVFLLEDLVAWEVLFELVIIVDHFVRWDVKNLLIIGLFIDSIVGESVLEEGILLTWVKVFLVLDKLG